MVVQDHLALRVCLASGVPGNFDWIYGISKQLIVARSL
jgi:hypothetical protein